MSTLRDQDLCDHLAESYSQFCGFAILLDVHAGTQYTEEAGTVDLAASIFLSSQHALTWQPP